MKKIIQEDFTLESTVVFGLGSGRLKKFSGKYAFFTIGEREYLVVLPEDDYSNFDDVKNFARERFAADIEKHGELKMIQHGNSRFSERHFIAYPKGPMRREGVTYVESLFYQAFPGGPPVSNDIIERTVRKEYTVIFGLDFAYDYGKFMLFKIYDRGYIVILSHDDYKYHEDISKFFYEKYKEDLEKSGTVQIFGGAEFGIDEEGDTHIYGSSEVYGVTDYAVVRNVLNFVFPKERILALRE